MKIGSLVVEIAADSSKFDSAVSGTETRLGALSKKATAAVGNFAKYSAAAAAAGGAITAALYVKASQAIDAQAKLAQQLNTTSSSMATITRAGELSGIGIEKITSASRALTTRLAQASTGMGPAVDGIERLGLSADKLASLPLDERIATINQRIRETVPASQQAALAAQFFGEEAGTAILTLSGDTLAQARKETELFGLALSDVDAAKVEMANDAFSTFGMAADGIIQQLTVQLAPIVKAISDEFVNAADEAGGFGNIAIDAFEKVINVAAFVADAADGVKRVFELMSDRIILVINRAMAVVSKIVSGILSGLSRIPGVDFSETVNSLNQFSSTSFNIVKQARENIDKTLAKPMAGDALRQFVDDARAAGEAAAQAAIEGRASVQDGGEMAGGLSPEAQRAKEELAARIEAIRQANLTEMELLNEKQSQEMESLRAFYEGKDELWSEFAQMELETIARHEDEKTELERIGAEGRARVLEMEAAAKRQAMSDMYSNLTSLMNTNSRALFNIGKAAAMAQIALNIPESASDAYKGGLKVSGGNPAVGAAFAAAATIAQLNQLNNIKGQQFGGGGGGGAAAVGQGSSNVAAQPAQAQGPSQTMTVSGIDEGELFTGSRVKSLVGELLEYQRNGGEIILA